MDSSSPPLSISQPAATVPPSAALTPTDLAELMSAFNAVTGRLQDTHEQLRGEVARLSRELTDANEQLQRSKRLAELGEMAAGIAHEIRNPLGSITLFARMLRDDLAEKPPQQKLAEKIITATKGLNAVVGDVLTFSREFRVHSEECELSEILDRAIEACQHDGVGGWETVEIVRKDNEAPRDARRIALDSSLAIQALTNIIRNSVEAMVESESPRRILTIEVRKQTAADSTGKRRRSVGLRISDTGPGLSDEVMSRMFNPFFTTRKAGTGLGLAIVHRIMDAHAGRVVASNNGPSGSGSGATIELLFPASPVAQSAPRERAESSRANASSVPIGGVEQNLPLVAVAVRPDRRLSGAA